LNERQDEYELHWPSIFTSLPEIRAKQDGAGKAGPTQRLEKKNV
jgi:hypothetical protein